MQNRAIAMGVGARRGAQAEDLAAFLREAAARLGLDATGLPLCTLAKAQDEEAFVAAARLLGGVAHFFAAAELKAREAEALTRSARVAALFGLANVAELAALAGAGPGSALLAPRIAAARYTCAFARAAAPR
jgi:cobalt-precorrin 5A hydrolase